MSKSINYRSTKSEIWSAFKALKEEQQKMEEQVKRLQKDKEALEKQTARFQKTPSPSEASPEKSKEEKAIQKPAPPSPVYSISQVLAGLADIQSGFGNAISELSTHLTAEATQLLELLRQVEDEIRQLETRYELQISDTTLDELIQEYNETSERSEKELRQLRETFEQEMAERKAAWKKEQSDQANFIKERDELAREAAKREEAEYQYQLKRQRQIKEEEYQQEQKKLQRELARLKEVQQQEWDERESQISQREKEWEEHRTRVENFPQEREATLAKAGQEGQALAQREVKNKVELRAKEVEGERRVDELKISAFEDTIKNQLQQIKELSGQLELVLKQTQDLAVKAIEGASRPTSQHVVQENRPGAGQKPPQEPEK